MNKNISKLRKSLIYMVPGAGVEPARYFYRGILSFSCYLNHIWNAALRRLYPNKMTQSDCYGSFLGHSGPKVLLLLIGGILAGSVQADVNFGTITRSIHFDGENHNESHNGVYASYNGWTIGRFTNSDDMNSTLFGYSTTARPYRRIHYNWFIGAANNYDKNKPEAYKGILGIAGLSIKKGYFKVMITPALVSMGFEF